MLKSLTYTEPVYAFIVENISARGIPRNWARSRSTSKYNWGISACNEEDTPERALSFAGVFHQRVDSIYQILEGGPVTSFHL